MPLSESQLSDTFAEPLHELAGGGSPILTTLVGGASLRRYHRALIPGGNPQSIVVMELGDDRRSEEIAHSGVPSELPFVNVLRYLEAGRIAVPRLLAYDEPRGLLYLEDLGDVTFESRVVTAPPDHQRTWYRLAIDALLGLQRYAAAHPSGCIAFSRGFDLKLLEWELHHFLEWGLVIGVGAQITSSETDEIKRHFLAIAEQLAAEPRVFVHRDFQSRNLMVQESPAGPRLRLIDFQDALMGTYAYDLVALLRDSYVVLPPQLVTEFVEYYAAGAALDPIAFRRLFDLQTVQRKLKDAGRFVFIDRVKKNPDFLQHIPSSHAYVAAALSRLPSLAPLQEILSRYIPALMG